LGFEFKLSVRTHALII